MRTPPRSFTSKAGSPASTGSSTFKNDSPTTHHIATHLRSVTNGRCLAAETSGRQPISNLKSACGKLLSSVCAQLCSSLPREFHLSFQLCPTCQPRPLGH